MKKSLLSIILSFFVCMNAGSMISPDAMMDIINQSQIKTPAVVKNVKTVQTHRGTRIQMVEFEGLYENSGKTYNAKCHNFKSFYPWDVPTTGGPKYYYPKKGERVFVTISYQGGEITSMIIMDKNFEKKYKSNPKAVKYDCNGAYFE